jgi:hypothetical protein
VFSNAHGSALHRTYAAAVKKPTGNTATPSQSPPQVSSNHPWPAFGAGQRASPKNSMQKPAVWRPPLAKNPQPHAVKIDRREIVASDIAPIPPTGLDTLRLT